MRTKRLMTALVIAGCAAIGVAAPAVAQTSAQIDSAFLQAIKQRNVPVTDDASALALAHKTCDVLNGGGSTNEALQMLQESQPKWSTDDIVNFGGLAVYAYCRDHLPQQQ